MSMQNAEESTPLATGGEEKKKMKGKGNQMIRDKNACQNQVRARMSITHMQFAIKH